MELNGYKIFWMEHDGVPPKVSIEDAQQGLIKFDAENAKPGIYEMMLESEKFDTMFFKVTVK